MNNKEKNHKDLIDMEVIMPFMRKYWPVLAICSILGLSLAFFINKVTQPVYQVGASLLVKSSQNQSFQAISKVFEGMGMVADEKSFQNEILVMKSSPLIRNAIKNLDFQVSYYDRVGFGSKELYKTSPFIVAVNQNHGQPINTVFNVEIMNDKSYEIKAKAGKTSIYNFSGGNIIEELPAFKIDGAGEFGADVVSDYYDFKIMLNENFNPNEHKSNKFSFVIHDIHSMVRAYQEEITVAPVDLETSVARISIKSEVPAKAIDLITSITDEYLSKDVQEKIHAAVKTTEYIDNQLGAISDSLQNAEMNLQRFRTSNQVIDITMKSGRAYDQLRDLEKEKAGILVKYKYYQHINEYFEKNKEISDLIAPSSMGIEDPLLNNLIQELTRLNAEKVSLIENNQGKSPYIKQINIKIDNLKNTISENIKYIMSTTEISLQEIEGRLNQLNAEINKLPTTERQLLGYERKFNLNDAIYTFLLERRAEAQIAKASYLSGAEIIEPTDIIGSRPVSPKKNLNYILGLILGLFIPFMAIRLKDIIQNRITDSTDLNKITDLPILGQVYTNNKKIELVVNNFPKSHIAESFRILRTGLNYFIHPRDCAVIVITSSFGQEGKSFISNNLAVSLATSNKKTVLLGFDLRKPKVYERMNIDNLTGVSSYLSNQANLEDIVQKTNIDNLDVITSGPVPPNPSELITTGRTNDLINNLKNAYEVIIIDTPPVGIISDTFLLMGMSDLNIFVVRQNQTPKNEFLRIIRDLKVKKIKNLCLVINDIRLIKKSKYGYEYYEK